MIYPFSHLFNKTCHLAVFISEEGGLMIGFILCLFVDWPLIGGGGGGGGVLISGEGELISVILGYC